MSSLFLLSICSIYLLQYIFETGGFSTQFGCMHSSAVPIYEVQVDWNVSVHYLDYVEQGKKKFIINQILVFDESKFPQSTIMTKVIRGGVGFNFTRVQLTNNDKKNARVTILIYGIRHVHDIMFCKK